MLRISNLSVRYGSIVAVRDVSLDVNQGELVALVGPNGAGKSSTLRAASGMERTAGGTIEFAGRPLRGRPPEDIVRSGLVLVPEGRHILTGLTVRENLLLGASARSDRKTIRADLDRQYETFPILRARAQQPAGLLSGGEQQQLAIARAVMGRPKMMLLDEPSLGLAPRMVDLVFEAVAELCRQGLTVLLVEQNANRAVLMADRYYLMRTGELVRTAPGGPDQLAGLAAEYLSAGVGGTSS